MNVHPSVGLNPPGPTTTEPFATEARYELKIDTDDDIANITYVVSFSSAEGGQHATVRLVDGAGGKVIFDEVPVSTGREGQVAQVGDHRFFSGWRSDPFFFDVLGTLDKFQFTSGDFFADKDTCSIVQSGQGSSAFLTAVIIEIMRLPAFALPPVERALIAAHQR
jgi:hypothetical protein